LPIGYNITEFVVNLAPSDDQLRQPVFMGLRSDKQAKEVVRE
jgi:hypothetical protein